MGARLILGTVQFGMPYGIVNRTGQVQRREVDAILRRAHGVGLNTLDTAVAYRDSEQSLGDVGVGDWAVVTKLPPIPSDCSNVNVWVRNMLEGSMRRLRISHLYGLLLHRSEDLAGIHGPAIYAEMSALRAEGCVRKIGISIYDPSELDDLSLRYQFDLVQAPLNVFDRRIRNSGWLTQLHDLGTEVHVRSIFLQGVLLTPASERPARFLRWQHLWEIWDTWLQARKVTPLQACLAFAASQRGVDGVVVGVDSSRQLEEILAIDIETSSITIPEELSSEDPDLINPSRWSAL